jgi:hypothetical protein
MAAGFGAGGGEFPGGAPPQGGSRWRAAGLEAEGGQGSEIESGSDCYCSGFSPDGE